MAVMGNSIKEGHGNTIDEPGRLTIIKIKEGGFSLICDEEVTAMEIDVDQPVGLSVFGQTSDLLHQITVDVKNERILWGQVVDPGLLHIRKIPFNVKTAMAGGRELVGFTQVMQLAKELAHSLKTLGLPFFACGWMPFCF